MAQIQNIMKIDFSEPIASKITAKQNDANSRFLTVHLYNNGTPLDITGHKVRIYMRKPDGKEIFNDGEITSAAYGQCKFELTSQALGAVGVLNCEISLYKDNTQILTTETFHVFVSENLRAAGSVESSNEYGALEVLYADLTNSLELMQYMVDEFGTAGSVASSAGANTFWAMLEALYTVNDNALKNASVSEVLDRIGANTNDNATTLFGLLKNSTYGLSAIKDIVDKAKFSKMINFVSNKVSISANGNSVTAGTWNGRGTLYIEAAWSTAKVTVDGKTYTLDFTKLPCYQDNGTVPIPFEKSLKLVLNATDSNVVFTYAIVFI